MIAGHPVKTKQCKDPVGFPGRVIFFAELGAPSFLCNSPAFLRNSRYFRAISSI
jgi:hypothetical protein